MSQKGSQLPGFESWVELVEVDAGQPPPQVVVIPSEGQKSGFSPPFKEGLVTIMVLVVVIATAALAAGSSQQSQVSEVAVVIENAENVMEAKVDVPTEAASAVEEGTGPSSDMMLLVEQVVKVQVEGSLEPTPAEMKKLVFNFFTALPDPAQQKPAGDFRTPAQLLQQQYPQVASQIAQDFFKGYMLEASKGKLSQGVLEVYMGILNSLGASEEARLLAWQNSQHQSEDEPTAGSSQSRAEESEYEANQQPQPKPESEPQSSQAETEVQTEEVIEEEESQDKKLITPKFNLGIGISGGHMIRQIFSGGQDYTLVVTRVNKVGPVQHVFFEEISGKFSDNAVVIGVTSFQKGDIIDLSSLIGELVKAIR